MNKSGWVRVCLIFWFQPQPGYQYAWYWVNQLSMKFSVLNVNFHNLQYYNAKDVYEMQVHI